jgi:hypothetical protein
LREAGDIAARPRQAFDEAAADRVNGLREHDWHGAAHLPYHLPAPSPQDHVRREGDEFCGLLPSTLIIAWTPTMIYPQTATDSPAQLL